jgi:hypothetical protein
MLQSYINKGNGVANQRNKGDNSPQYVSFASNHRIYYKCNIITAQATESVNANGQQLHLDICKC